MSKKIITISTVGYKAVEGKPDTYESKIFTKVLSVPEHKISDLENGSPLPEEYQPKLEKGWYDSPEKATKTQTYEFKPVKALRGVEVID